MSNQIERGSQNSLVPDVYGEGDVHVRLRATIISHTVLLPWNSCRKCRSMQVLMSNLNWSEIFLSSMTLTEVPFRQLRTSKVDNLMGPQAQFDTIVKLINYICHPPTFARLT